MSEKVKQKILENNGQWCGDSVVLSGRSRSVEVSENDTESSPYAGFNGPRQKALERDEYECQICEGEQNLEVHHKKPVEDGGTHNLSNLITLCEVCHPLLERMSVKRQETLLEKVADN